MPNNSSKLISLMFVIGRRMRDEMKEVQGKSGCSWLHFEALCYVQGAGQPTMRDIADHFSITPPAATLLVDGLVANGMMRRIVDAKDRRTVHLVVMPKGTQILKRGVQARMRKIKEVFSILNAKEHAELIRILGKIAK